MAPVRPSPEIATAVTAPPRCPVVSPKAATTCSAPDDGGPMTGLPWGAQAGAPASTRASHNTIHHSNRAERTDGGI